jgi:hypothetical protein
MAVIKKLHLIKYVLFTRFNTFPARFALPAVKAHKISFALPLIKKFQINAILKF